MQTKDIVCTKAYNRASARIFLFVVQGPKKWFAKCDKHYPSRFRQTSLATAVTNFTIITVPSDGIKRDPERESCAVLTIAAQMANSIHIRVTFNAVTRYVVARMLLAG